jgi:hypothetical protein
MDCPLGHDRHRNRCQVADALAARGYLPYWTEEAEGGPNRM